MKQASRSAERFVEAVYRRLRIARAVEQFGLGMLMASVLAIGLFVLAIWQSIPTVPILIFWGVCGLCCGTVLAIHGRPTRRWAVIETDRQLRLDDLLTTALFTTDKSDADFRAIVMNMADARCATYSPDDVLLRRMGVRSWGTVALAMCTAITLAVIPFEPSRLQAVDANKSVLSAGPTDTASPLQQSNGAMPVVNDSRSETGSNAAMSIAEQPADSTQNSGQSRSSSNRGNTAGTGGGSATTTALPGRDPMKGESSGRSSTPTGTIATGGDASHRTDGHGDATGGSAGTSTPVSVPAWAGDRSANPLPGTISTEDRIPPEDRDLIRDFFKR